MVTRIALLLAGVAVVIAVVQAVRADERELDTSCGRAMVAAPPLYAAESTGYATPEDAAREGLRFLLTEDDAVQLSDEEWASVQLRSGGPGSTSFSGTFEDVLPDSDRGAFTLTVSETEAGGYLFYGGKVCLDER